ncbi:conserved Plasmodium protein, unknown function [Plasmodium gallinaceum]|uniref:Uncharacterized protein n=1 Tax=Plasmodium gallinaceum TaxID=5849 RepID=A0A1J1GX33_PLAGA|nr:conserved Plasmodium protein, unknown function [Plasmodium gallinaceum]CRG96870.1 conserved Plasmodium protein, unknown function [Plasmodium gallinaceum]
MALKKIYNGHFRRIPSCEKIEKRFSTDKNVEKSNENQNSEKKVDYGIVDNIIYGAGIGVGAVGLALAIISSTVIASTLLFSTYFCVNTCNAKEEEIIDGYQ